MTAPSQPGKEDFRRVQEAATLVARYLKAL